MRTIRVGHWLGNTKLKKMYKDIYDEEMPKHGWLLEAYDELDWFIIGAVEGDFDIMITGNILWIDDFRKEFTQR